MTNIRTQMKEIRNYFRRINYLALCDKHDGYHCEMHIGTLCNSQNKTVNLTYEFYHMLKTNQDIKGLYYNHRFFIGIKNKYFGKDLKAKKECNVNISASYYYYKYTYEIPYDCLRTAHTLLRLEGKV